MGILENFENAWDVEYESKPIIETNNLGEPIVQGTEESSLDKVIDN